MANADDTPTFEPLESLEGNLFDTELPDAAAGDDAATAAPGEGAAPPEPAKKKGWLKRGKKPRAAAPPVEEVSREAPSAEPIGEHEGAPREKATDRLVAVLKDADLFTVMLSVALLAVVIAVFCLMAELWRYGFDIKAKAGKQPVAAAILAAGSDAIQHVDPAGQLG